MVMSRLSLAFGLGAIGLIGCGGQPADQTFVQRILPHHNPTNYTFLASIADVKHAVAKAYGGEWEKELAEKNRGKVWMGNADARSTCLLNKTLQEPMPLLLWKENGDGLAKGLLTKPGNENDAYVYNADAPMKSQVYFKDGQPLIYYADFHIHLTPFDSRTTRVEIFTYDPNVGIGLDTRWAPHGPRLIGVAVAASTVEEYEILLRIGAALGVTNMPALVTPPPDAPVRQVTKQQR